MPQQDSYISLPNGSYVHVPGDATPEQLSSLREKLRSQTGPPAQQQPSGASGSWTPIESTPTNRATRRNMQAQPGITPEMRKADPTTGRIVTSVPAVIGAMAAPELIPEMGPFSGLLARSLATGAGAGVGTSVGQSMNKLNPFAAKQMKDAALTGTTAAATDLLFGSIPALSKTKLGRSVINESLGASGKDVIYGNPAKAMYSIGNPFTGDIEKMKTALRAGKSLPDAELAAGGRLGALSSKIVDLGGKLDAVVKASNSTVKAVDVIDLPLMKITTDVISNPAITDTDKIAIVNHLGEFQKSLHQGIGTDISMTDALRIKRAVGNEAGNWLTPPRNEVQEAYRDVYGALKQAIHKAVPPAAKYDEDLTDAIAAKNSVEKLARNQEVGMGVGIMRSNMGRTWLGRLETAIGDILPGTAKVSKATRPVATGAAAGITSDHLANAKQRLKEVQEQLEGLK